MKGYFILADNMVDPSRVYCKKCGAQAEKKGGTWFATNGQDEELKSINSTEKHISRNNLCPDCVQKVLINEANKNVECAEKLIQNKINETIKTNTKRVWIGDPCYVIQDELWDDVCYQIFKGGHKETGFVITVKYNGQELSFIMCGTAYGDGVFNSQSGFEYSVDCGSLGIVPEELIHKDKLEENEIYCGTDSELGKMFEIENDNISLQTDGKGTFIFSDGDKVIEKIWTGGKEN